MSETQTLNFSAMRQRNWVRLRTIIVLRWVAIFGQIVAIEVALRVFGLRLEIGLCYLAVGASVIGNLIATFVFPENKRLSEVENLLMLLFDLLQLSFLLFLTGGLNNPFALLILGPVCISSAVLSLRSSIILGVVACLVITVLANFYIPLRTDQGFIMRIPQIFVFGNWAALIIAILFLTAYARRISGEIGAMSDALQATSMALSREQKLHDVGGVVAAAAHELGTPLATIKLTSSELREDLSDRPDLAEDAALISEQADRCRDILRSMGRAGKDDLHMRTAPLSALLDEAAEPHAHRGKVIHFEMLGNDPEDQPHIRRLPEVIHGMRNLVQNAVDFARANVWVETRWTETTIEVRIIDDGAGFPTQVIGRIGDPFMRRRRSEVEREARPEYEGMGLGLFIAKTLLERSGAVLNFANGTTGSAPTKTPKRGAIVQVTWPREKIEAETGAASNPLGENVLNPTY